MAKTPRGWTGARTPSAMKRVRQAERRRAINQPRESAAKTYVANALKVAAGTRDGDTAEALAEAMSALDKAAKVGAIHPNAAARRKSRLTLKINALAGGAAIQPTARTAKTTGTAAAAKAARTRIATARATKAKGPQTAAGKARAALSKTARTEAPSAPPTAPQPQAAARPRATRAAAGTAGAAPKAAAPKAAATPKAGPKTTRTAKPKAEGEKPARTRKPKAES